MVQSYINYHARCTKVDSQRTQKKLFEDERQGPH